MNDAVHHDTEQARCQYDERGAHAQAASPVPCKARAVLRARPTSGMGDSSRPGRMRYAQGTKLVLPQAALLQVASPDHGRHHQKQRAKAARRACTGTLAAAGREHPLV